MSTACSTPNAYGPDSARWRHNASHRQGVSYRDNVTREKLGMSMTGAEGRNGFRGRLGSLTVFVMLLLADPAQGLAAVDSESGLRVAQAKCAACHGAGGNSTDSKTPKLAGQNPAYLYQQLRAYRAGARHSDIMAGVAAGLSERDMADTASFYSRQPIQPEPVRYPVLQAEGQRIFSVERRGIAGTCAACHDAQGRTPAMAATPKLNGQHAAYLVDQLNRYAKGERQSTVMAPIAASLSEFERRAVAEFLASRRAN